MLAFLVNAMVAYPPPCKFGSFASVVSNVIGVKHVKKEHGEVYEEGLIVPNTLLLDLTWGRKG